MIALWNLEPKYTNIALEKIRMYYEEQGETVVDYLLLEHHLYREVYVSSLFKETSKIDVTRYMICGGTGFDLTTKLPKEIEKMNPKINMGFTTRGCIRNCGFCVVSRKEGKIKVVGDIYDFWDGKNKEITILDNNILAVWSHFEIICRQILKEKLTVNFTQGLDVRLIDRDRAKLINMMKHKKQIYFAWDNMEDESRIRWVIESSLRDIPSYKIAFYVLIGYDTSPAQDLYRVRILHDYGIDSFVMPFNKNDEYQRKFARWVNHKAIFKTVSWMDYK